MTVLSDFIITEREQYADKDSNLFAFSLGQALRYHEFMLIIADRHREVSQRMVLNSKKMMESTPSHSSGPVTDEQMRLLEEGRQLTTLVHLEVESFYLFAKISLDKIALFLHNYFGQAQGIRLKSHDDLAKYHKRFGLAKGLIYPEGFSETLTLLKEHVCDYRDKQISHLHSLRAIKATMYDASGQTRIATTQLYPDERDGQVESEELPELIHVIDVYIQQIIALVESNRNKTRFKLRM